MQDELSISTHAHLSPDATSDKFSTAATPLRTPSLGKRSATPLFPLSEKKPRSHTRSRLSEVRSVENVSEAMLTAADAFRLPQSIKIETEQSSPERRRQVATHAIDELEKHEELSTQEFVSAVGIFEKNADIANAFVSIKSHVRRAAYIKEKILELKRNEPLEELEG